MKILMGLSQVDLDKKYVTDAFIDFSLDEMVSHDACENFNTLYTLYYCTKHLDYRREEIKEFALNEVDNWIKFYHKEFGGFSFYKNKAQTKYYNAKVSKGLNEPDLHGTAMFAWGILIVAEILNIDKELGLKNPVM